MESGTASPDSLDQTPETAPLARARQLAGVSVGTGGVTLWLALLGLITTPIMIHHLGTTRYGVFALITILSAYLSNLEFGFGHATARFLARARAAGDRDEQKAVLSTSLFVFLVAGVVAAVVVVVGAPWITGTFFHGREELRPEVTEAIRLGAGVLLASFISSFASASLQAIGAFHMVVGCRLVFGTLASAAAVTAVLVGGKLPLVLLVQVGVASGLCAALLVSLSRSAGVRLVPAIHRQTFRSMLRFGVFILISGLAYQTLLQGPPTVLAHFAPTAQLAAFAVPNLILQQLAQVATATSVAFMPFASAASINRDRSHLAAVYSSNIRLTFLVFAPIVAFAGVFAHPLLSTWIGSSFAAKAGAPLQFLCVAALMLALSSAPADVVRGLGHPRFVALFTLIAAVIAVATAFITAPGHGAAGVAFSLSLAAAVTTLPAIVLVATRTLDVAILDFARALLKPLVAVIILFVLFLGIAFVQGTFLGAVLAGLIGLLLYTPTVFRYALTNQERDALMTLVRRAAPSLLRRFRRA